MNDERIHIINTDMFKNVFLKIRLNALKFSNCPVYYITYTYTEFLTKAIIYYTN